MFVICVEVSIYLLLHDLHDCVFKKYLVGIKAKERISKAGVTRKQNTSNFPKKDQFQLPDTLTYVCVSGTKKCSFFGKFGALFSCDARFEIRPFALLPMNWDPFIQRPLQRIFTVRKNWVLTFFHWACMSNCKMVCCGKTFHLYTSFRRFQTYRHIQDSQNKYDKHIWWRALRQRLTAKSRSKMFHLRCSREPRIRFYILFQIV